jgi:hypothetical protein
VSKDRSKTFNEEEQVKYREFKDARSKTRGEYLDAYKSLDAKFLDDPYTVKEPREAGVV